MAWWQQTFDYARQIYSLTKSSTRHDTEIRELRDEVKRLSDSLQDVIFERQRDRDSAEHARQVAQLEHELLLSRLQTKLLSYERSLPSPANSQQDDTVL